MDPSDSLASLFLNKWYYSAYYHTWLRIFNVWTKELKNRIKWTGKSSNCD